MKTETLKMFDVVALLRDEIEHKVVKGQVGTIVEYLAEGVFEVEFANKFGETISEFAVKAEDLLKLHHELEYA
jgi:Domain of unknown function (DUF4926)